MALTIDEITSSLHSIAVTDGGGSLTVDAVQLDIDDLTFADDKVDVSGSEVSLDAATLAALESITVVASQLDIDDLTFADDKVDVGGSVIALDAATLAALETVNVIPGGFSSWLVSAIAVTDTQGQILASPLANRLKLELQNLGTVACYVRDQTGVTTSNGFKIPAGSSWEQNLDASADVWAVAATAAGCDIRAVEYAS